MLYWGIGVLCLCFTMGCGVQRATRSATDSRTKYDAAPPGSARLVVTGRDFRRWTGDPAPGGRIANEQGEVVGEAGFQTALFYRAVIHARSAVFSGF